MAEEKDSIIAEIDNMLNGAKPNADEGKGEASKESETKVEAETKDEKKNVEEKKSAEEKVAAPKEKKPTPEEEEKLAPKEKGPIPEEGGEEIVAEEEGELPLGEEEPPPEEEEPPEPTEEDEDYWRKALNETAKEQLEEKGASGKKAAKGEKEEKGEKKEKEKSPIEIPSIKISKEEWSDAMESEEGFEKVVQKVDDAFSSRLQEIIRALPEVIEGIAKETTKTYFAISDFFQANRDLIPFKALVSLTADKLFAKYPDKDLEEVMEDVGKEVRKKLRLEKKENSRVTKSSARKPAIVTTKTSRKPEPVKLTGMEAEISDMLSLQ